MPKLPDLKFSHTSKGGEKIEFSCSCNVNKEGLFSIRLPDEYDDFRETVRKVIEREQPHKVWIEPYRKVFHHLKTYNLGVGEKIINQAAEEYIQYEVKHEIVILYTKDTHCQYALDEEDKIFANAAEAQRHGTGKYEGGGVRWGGDEVSNVFSDLKRSYFVGFGARVCVKQTLTRGDYVKVDYCNPSHSHMEFGYKVDYDHLGSRNYMERLNGFPHLNLDTRSCKEIPYTEEAAKFFYDAMIGLCKLHNMISSVLDDQDTLEKAIESQKGLLIGKG